MDGTRRENVKIGLRVLVIQKPHQRSGQTTEGVVERLLTSSAVHTRGIKVRLEGGVVGRVKEILD